MAIKQKNGNLQENLKQLKRQEGGLNAYNNT
jgi:hypothetical protein